MILDGTDMDGRTSVRSSDWISEHIPTLICHVHKQELSCYCAEPGIFMLYLQSDKIRPWRNQNKGSKEKNRHNQITSKAKVMCPLCSKTMLLTSFQVSMWLTRILSPLQCSRNLSNGSNLTQCFQWSIYNK